MKGWRSVESRDPDGSFRSEQTVELAAPVVPASEQGARRLACTYWREIDRSTRGIARARESEGRVELRFRGRRPLLLRFGLPELSVSSGRVSSRHPIEGGLLARRPGGAIVFEQADGMLRCAVSGFHASRWYGPVQARVHVPISRRYFRRLLG